MGVAKKQKGHGDTLLWAAMSPQVVIGLCKRKETAALKNEPPLHGRMEMCLLYDGFFSFAVVRQNGLVIISERCPLLLV